MYPESHSNLLSKCLQAEKQVVELAFLCTVNMPENEDVPTNSHFPHLSHVFSQIIPLPHNMCLPLKESLQ